MGWPVWLDYGRNGSEGRIERVDLVQTAEWNEDTYFLMHHMMCTVSCVSDFLRNREYLRK